MGHNRFYEQVLLPMRTEFMGKLVKVRITNASKFSMIGEPLDDVIMPGLSKPLEKGVVSGLKMEGNEKKVSFQKILDVR